ncbi:hypothetical protein [Actinomadura sp. 21ATH]|uniref:hypothetical protein n=1 Tax=Actinomadura sp. 21ATH TaxID=1735444 RepID=UPI0035C05C6C
MAETTGSPVTIRSEARGARGRVTCPLAAVSLGVAWPAGTLVLGDTLAAALDRLPASGPERGGSLTLLRDAPAIFGTVALLVAGLGVHRAFAATRGRRAPERARVPPAEHRTATARILVGLVLAAIAAGAVVTGALIGSASMTDAGAAMTVAVTALLGPAAARLAAVLTSASPAGIPRGGPPAARDSRCAAGVVMVGAGAVALLAVVAGAARAAAGRLPAGTDASALAGAVDGMFALAVVVVLLGTVGMPARPVRARMVRAVPARDRAGLWEALVGVLLGTAAGTGIGLFLGWALTRARDAPFAAQPLQIGLIVVAGAAAGIPIAARAARRGAAHPAAKMR